MKKMISCIIPFYNEGKRTIEVLKIISKVNNCNQIICVDDGSNDNTSEIIIKQFPRIELIRLSKNTGKTYAVEKGLNLAKGEYVMLLDGDLKNLKTEELTTAINKVLENNEIDMLILRRVNSLTAVKLLRGDILLSGERIIKKKQLKEILNRFKPKKYEIEVAINEFMLKNEKKTFWFNSSAVNTAKIEKYGILEGIKKDFISTLNFLFFIGFFNYILQIFFFCRNSI